MYTRSVTEFAVPLLFKLINHSVSRQQPNQKKNGKEKNQENRFTFFWRPLTKAWKRCTSIGGC
jgi:hypothetical protein